MYLFIHFNIYLYVDNNLYSKIFTTYAYLFPVNFNLVQIESYEIFQLILIIPIVI